MKFSSKFYTYFFLGLLLASLSGCGFHLRGMLDMPSWLDNIAIVNANSKNHPLDVFLQEQLQAYDVHVTTEPSLAQYWLIIERDAFQQQISSISASTTPRQYQLIYTVQFKVQQVRGHEIIPSSLVSVTRQITINSDRILGSDEEEATTKREMRREAAIQILNRLSRHE
ncbi:LPS-assembly lipoprotein LptE [Legionella septentrionalis]|uniref:LPS-assembly lipoprotein LptE n=1 Tax=Legionella septentrionalis TaxID=2498109 RepID=A0A433JIM4_9GAMM|nr:LPS assembly lipoprotein LptE [Legionella septentrionalis]RUQ85186.1 hypothetical protein EKM59_07150 [Legionella septentrionalis]